MEQLRRAVYPSMSCVLIGCSGLGDRFSHQSKAPGDWDGLCVSLCLMTSNTSHNFCRLSRAQISANGRKIQPHHDYYYYCFFFLFFFFTHDALVCHVASTTEKTWLQTTRDQHMHPSVRLCVLSCECVFSINVKMCDCKRARLEMCLAVELWERNVQKKKNRGMCFSCSYVCGVWFVSLCVDCFKVLGMHRSTGSEQRMQLEAWPSVQHENSTTNLHLCVYFWS